MQITVIGSSNTDMVVRTAKLPAPGETMLGGTFFMNPGGKGANQAVAAARLGGKVCLVTKTGNDIFGKQAIAHLSNENVNTQYCCLDSSDPSGVALITVDESGENCIVVAPGANKNLLPTDIATFVNEILQPGFLLMQLEIPMSTILFTAKLAYQKGVKIILNPAPAFTLSDELLGLLYLITPNETEAALLTGIEVKDKETAVLAAHKLRNKGCENVIITLGSKGALLVTDNLEKFFTTEKVKVIDTTAAGDVFNGALTVALAEGLTLEKAAVFANKAAGISVTRLGAQASAPYRNEMNY